eukprot:759607-Hanusia_phi.AAC.1
MEEAVKRMRKEAEEAEAEKRRMEDQLYDALGAHTEADKQVRRTRRGARRGREVRGREGKVRGRQEKEERRRAKRIDGWPQVKLLTSRLRESENVRSLARACLSSSSLSHLVYFFPPSSPLFRLSPYFFLIHSSSSTRRICRNLRNR